MVRQVVDDGAHRERALHGLHVEARCETRPERAVHPADAPRDDVDEHACAACRARDARARAKCPIVRSGHVRGVPFVTRACSARKTASGTYAAPWTFRGPSGSRNGRTSSRACGSTPISADSTPISADSTPTTVACRCGAGRLRRHSPANYADFVALPTLALMDRWGSESPDHGVRVL